MSSKQADRRRTLRNTYSHLQKLYAPTKIFSLFQMHIYLTTGTSDIPIPHKKNTNYGQLEMI